MIELAERDATGRVAAIYADIRRLWAVPYVSSLERHLAALPGWLEWAWAALGPAFASGRAQTRAWRAVEGLDMPGLNPITRAALRVWGVDGAGEAAVRGVCASFVRVSPVNLVFAGLLRRLLDGERPAGAPCDDPGWAPPEALPPLPAFVDPAAQTPAERDVLASLATTTDGAPFVPGLYRVLAHWPALLAHLAIELTPRLGSPETATLFARVNRAIDAVVPEIFAGLPAVPALPAMPPEAEFDAVRAALDTYRKTSPEMVVFGSMIGGALPALEGARRSGPRDAPAGTARPADPHSQRG